MNTTEIERLATELIERENKTNWKYEIGVPERVNRSIWTVLVRWISPDGDLLDGPGIIEVDEHKATAWFVETC